MSTRTEATIVVVPGLRDHVPDHWQTILAERLTAAGRTVHTVAPLTENQLSCAARTAALEKVVATVPGPAVLVAHSAGVMTTVHWAQRTRRPVLGALLATPPDFDTPLPQGYPTPEELSRNGWTPTPRATLPFPSIVVSSSNDPLGSAVRIARLAEHWGSRLVRLGEVGHLNPGSGHGPWPQAEELIREIEQG